MTTKSDIEKVLWSACDSFRGKIDSSRYKDYILSMLFTDGITASEFQSGRSRQIVPDTAFMFLYAGNDQFTHISVFAGNIERIGTAAVKIAVHPYFDQSEIIEVGIEIWHNISSQTY